LVREPSRKLTAAIEREYGFCQSSRQKVSPELG
jgi:hypothetical protein